MVGDIFFAEPFGVFVAEILVEVLPGVDEFGTCAVEYREVVDENDAREMGHFALVDVFIYDIAYKQQFRLGVVDDVVYIVGLELLLRLRR